MFVQARNQWRN